ncbi:hypothetical protein J6590_039449 [Homalodisca vitripennis]|nr:hypothetical protein J6590_039449 [Homalodisca vitripennis]
MDRLNQRELLNDHQLGVGENPLKPSLISFTEYIFINRDANVCEYDLVNDGIFTVATETQKRRDRELTRFIEPFSPSLQFEQTSERSQYLTIANGITKRYTRH